MTPTEIRLPAPAFDATRPRQRERGPPAPRPRGRRSPQRAFVSASLRPFRSPRCCTRREFAEREAPASWRPDDRAARDLALDLRAYLAPRPVRFYPARGVRYESQLAPPPHLVGLRIAALDSLLEPDAARQPMARRSWSRARSRSWSGYPDPELRPHGFALELGQQIDLDETLERLVACGYERVEQVDDRGQFAAARRDPRHLSGDRGARRAGGAVRRRDRVAALVLDLHAALAGRGRSGRDRARRRARSRVSRAGRAGGLRGARRAPGHRRRAAGRALPLVPGADPRARPWSCSPPRRSSRPRSPTTGRTSRRACTRRTPTASTWRPRRRAGARASGWRSRFSAVSADQPHSFRAQAADTARAHDPGSRARAREARALRLPDGGRLGAPRRGRARRLQPRPPPPAAWSTATAAAKRGRATGRTLCFAVAGAARGLHRAAAEARRDPRPPAAAAPARGASPSRAGARASGRSPTCAPATSSCTPITASAASPASTRRPSAASRATTCALEYRGEDRVFVPTDQLEKLSRYVGANGHAPPLSKLGLEDVGDDEVAGPPRRARAGRRADQPLRRAQDARRPRLRRRTPTGSSSSSARSRIGRPTTSSRRSSRPRPTWRTPQPMDRLICGDVGYGKTEVALRAAFKAAADGKQVLFLVPTTILAQQHHGTFSERLRDYPFRIELLSRFRSREGAARGDQGLRRGQGRHPDRHAPAAVARRAAEGPRARDRRRGAALRRAAEGAAAPAAPARRRAVAVGDADPAHASDVARRAARHLGDRDAAGGPAADPHLRRRVRRGAREGGDRARAVARGAGVLPARPRRDDRRGRRAAARARARRRGWRSRTARWRRRSSSRR